MYMSQPDLLYSPELSCDWWKLPAAAVVVSSCPYSVLLCPGYVVIMADMGLVEYPYGVASSSDMFLLIVNLSECE